MQLSKQKPLKLSTLSFLLRATNLVKKNRKNHFFKRKGLIFTAILNMTKFL